MPASIAAAGIFNVRRSDPEKPLAQLPGMSVWMVFGEDSSFGMEFI
tara:strand:+ start:816 stop:953 length:138 start_codon:yes stop_codon:yes gene_type:complete